MGSREPRFSLILGAALNDWRRAKNEAETPEKKFRAQINAMMQRGSSRMNQSTSVLFFPTITRDLVIDRGKMQNRKPLLFYSSRVCVCVSLNMDYYDVFIIPHNQYKKREAHR